MANRLPLSAVIITLNEEENIASCLKSLAFTEGNLVVDSGSKDKTTEIARGLGATVMQHEWRGYGQQKNWAFQQLNSEWVLSIDADEVVSPQLAEEISAFIRKDGVIDGVRFEGAHFPRKTWYLGRWIMYGGWYPNRLVRLARRSKCHWTESDVHEALQVQGNIYAMKSDLYHYTFKDVGEQVQTNIKYSRLGARVAKERGENGSLGKILFKPIGKFLETYLWKMGFLDGFPGFIISVNAAHSIFMKYVELRYEKNSDRR